MYSMLTATATAILTAFLALSHGTASFIDRVATITEQPYAALSESVQSLPVTLEDTGSADTLFNRFRTDARYQQASLIGAVATSVPATTSSVAIADALVNVLCIVEHDDSSRTTSGSGVFIDTNGVILTNAHVAQFLLLAADDAVVSTRCVIRQGSPAISKYKAELLYISPAWIIANAHQLAESHPIGTGERDFALLYVTEALEDDELPASFPALLPNTDPGYRYITADIQAAGYPAEKMENDTELAPLVPAVATTSISRLFTFGSGEVELLAIAPSTVGRLGASGGPIIGEDGSVIGLITTRGDRQEEGAQSLRALTLPYVSATLESETGLTLQETLAGDLELRAAVFAETLAPYLRSLLSRYR